MQPETSYPRNLLLMLAYVRVFIQLALFLWVTPHHTEQSVDQFIEFSLVFVAEESFDN